jgi:hypothetical protein
MRRHCGPVRLVKVLANVLSAWVVGGMDLYRALPVVRGPDDIAAGHGRGGGEATSFLGRPIEARPSARAL